MRTAYFLTLFFTGLFLWGTLSPPGSPGGALPVSDKVIHAMAFVVLVIPLSWCDIRHIRWLIPMALCLGGAIELIQPLIGRSGEWADFLADSLGIAMGIIPGCIRAKVQHTPRIRQPSKARP